MKTCTKCGIEKTLGCFPMRKRAYDKVPSSWCRTCSNGAVKKISKQLRVEIATIKESSPCADCGLYYPAYVMDFDHRPGEVKIGPISEMISNNKCREQAFAEMAKCDLVCSNCHRERTYGNRQ